MWIYELQLFFTLSSGIPYSVCHFFLILIFGNTEILENVSSIFFFFKYQDFFLLFPLIYLYLKSNCHSPVRCVRQKQRTVGVPSVLPSDPSGASQLSYKVIMNVHITWATDKKISEKDRFKSFCHPSNFEFSYISAITYYNFTFYVSIVPFYCFKPEETS